MLKISARFQKLILNKQWINLYFVKRVTQTILNAQKVNTMPELRPKLIVCSLHNLIIEFYTQEKVNFNCNQLHKHCLPLTMQR